MITGSFSKYVDDRLITEHHFKKITEEIPMINRDINYLADGTRVLIDNRTGNRFVTVALNPDNKRDLVTNDGNLYVNKGYGTFENTSSPGDRTSVSWSGPFPELPDEEILKYHKTLNFVQYNLRNEHDPALLIHLTDVVGDVARGKLIQTVNSETRYGDDVQNTGNQTLGHIIISEDDVSIVSTSLPAESAIGDLVIASGFSCLAEKHDNGLLFYVMSLEHSATLGHSDTLDGLLKIIPDDTVEERASPLSLLLGFKDQSFKVMSIEDVRYQELAAKARTETNLGLFISTPDEHGECYLSYVDGIGIHLFGHSGNIVDVLKTECPPQGVWALTDPQYWAGPHHSDSGTEWDEELNGTFVPATADHLDQIGVSVGALGEIIIECMKDAGHQVGGDAVECGFAWLELAPSYPSEAPSI
jgi:hypothetical protein